MQTARKLLARFVAGASDAKLERRFGSGLMQRVMFSVMTASFNADAAAGFQGRLSYELGRPATEAPPLRWTVEVSGRRARARRGASDDAAVKLRVTLADFVRIGAGTIDPATPVLQGRASFQGDFGLVVRLPEMFGASRPRRARD
jgi:putative sterol carrier protein